MAPRPEKESAYYVQSVIVKCLNTVEPVSFLCLHRGPGYWRYGPLLQILWVKFSFTFTFILVSLEGPSPVCFPICCTLPAYKAIMIEENWWYELYSTHETVTALMCTFVTITFSHATLMFLRVFAFHGAKLLQVFVLNAFLWLPHLRSCEFSLGKQL